MNRMTYPGQVRNSTQNSTSAAARRSSMATSGRLRSATARRPIRTVRNSCGQMRRPARASATKRATRTERDLPENVVPHRRRVARVSVGVRRQRLRVKCGRPIAKDATRTERDLPERFSEEASRASECVEGPGATPPDQNWLRGHATVGTCSYGEQLLDRPCLSRSDVSPTVCRRNTDREVRLFSRVTLANHFGAEISSAPRMRD